MSAEPGKILTLNGGSSSIKFALFEPGEAPRRLASGQVERIGQPGAHLSASVIGTDTKTQEPINATDHTAAASAIFAWVDSQRHNQPLAAIGHRVVHGGLHLLDHQVITPKVLDELRAAQPLDLAHLPREISLIEAAARRFAGVRQVACFDTAFHRDLPRVARLLPIPRRYDAAGLRRFGFHGLSYAYLMQALRRAAGDAAANGRVILAHLGAGASMAAVKEGKPIETTMAFTPLAGLVMGTRSGDIDPGLLVYLLRTEELSADDLDRLLNHECGLKGISETSSDTRDLIARRSTDVRAAEALELFCYRARQWIGALAASMGGLDTLVFSGGIGEHAADLRAEIVRGLEFVGIGVDDAANVKSAAVISSSASRVVVRIIPTDEESVIAEVTALLSR